MRKKPTGHLVKTKPNKANRRPLAGNPKLEILNPKRDEWMINDRVRF